MRNGVFLDYAALQEWQADVISYEQAGEVYILQTALGRRCLRIMPSEEEAAAAADLSDYLRRRGFAAAPRPIRNRYGDAYTRAYNGWYYLTDAPPGQDVDYHDADSCIEAARLLGAFHKASQGYTPRGMLDFAGTDIAKGLLRYRGFACLGLRAEQDMAYLYQSLAEALAACDERKQQRLRQLYRRRGGLNLGGNIALLRREREEYYIADLGGCRGGGGICDLCELLLQAAKSNDYSLEASLPLLKAYNRENPLEREELDLLYAALLLPLGALRALNSYWRGEYAASLLPSALAAACEEEKEKNRWVKRLLM